MNGLLTLQRAAHASPVAIALLIAANLVPLVGVLLLGWDLATLVAIYWAENGVVGIYAVGRILTAGATRSPGTTSAGPAMAARLLLAPFFLVHYGLFWVVHGVFVWLALPTIFASFASRDTTGPVVLQPDGSVVLFAACVLLVSHGASFVLNWILGGEHATSNPAAEMNAPYSRVMVLHITIVLGAFAVAFAGAPVGALVVMIVLKTAVDLSAHLRERRRAELRRTAVSEPGPTASGLDAPAT